MADRPDAPIDGFDPGEIAIVCARYDVGQVVRAEPLGAGSTASPKVVLTTDAGRRYLLKRRGPGRDDPALVELTHDIQRRLAERRYPLAPLRAMRDGATMLTLDGRIYELFDWVEGRPYDRSVPSTRDAGRALAYFHRILAKHLPAQRPARSTYHDAAWVRAAMDRIAATPGGAEAVAPVRALYDRAAARATGAGLATWPRQIIHADWHPGNMLFREGRVAGVIDYDSARVGPRAVDVANGALQFSLTTGGSGCEDWPGHADLDRVGAFLEGYESVQGAVLSRAEIDALPWLMIEALVAEAVGPVAVEGRFGPFEGAAFLLAIARKAEWLARSRDRIRGVLNA